MRIAGLCKGSTADSDSVCEGSNPSPAASGRPKRGARLLFFQFWRKYEEIFQRFTILPCNALRAFGRLRRAGRAGGGGLSVVATVFAPYDFARQLVGERGEVTLLLPPGLRGALLRAHARRHYRYPELRPIHLRRRGVGRMGADVLDSVGGDVRTVTLMDCVELLEEEHVEGMEVDEARATRARSSTTSTFGPAPATPRSSAKR